MRVEFTREDHDRISTIAATVQALTVSVEALDRLVTETRNSDRRALEIADGAQEAALELARREMDSRLEKVNEFRGALSDAQATMMPRAEVTLLISSITAGLDEVKTAQTALLGQVIEMRSAGIGRDTSAERSRNLAFGIIGVLVGVAGVIVTAMVLLTR